jgi:aryl-alcohol dehydrogenase-like predicted oxidoreductase
MNQEKADSVLQIVKDAGINHIDVAASYGDAEIRLAPFLQDHRKDFFLATKTPDRSGDDARASIERSLDRMQVEQIDLIQFHNLSTDPEWDVVMGPNGALEAALQARDQGLVRFIGVTGHGTRIAEMHLKSLAEFEFTSVLLPYNQMLMHDEQYAKEFEELYALCRGKNVAMQTIKSIVRRRWREDDESPHFSWYEPIREEDALRRAVHWVLRRPGLFLNTSSDATLLPRIIQAAEDFDPANVGNLEEDITADVTDLQLEPLFERGAHDSLD